MIIDQFSFGLKRPICVTCGGSTTCAIGLGLVLALARLYGSLAADLTAVVSTAHGCVSDTRVDDAERCALLSGCTIGFVLCLRADSYLDGEEVPRRRRDSCVSAVLDRPPEHGISLLVRCREQRC